jgi:hypothetical protein
MKWVGENGEQGFSSTVDESQLVNIFTFGYAFW